MSKEEAWLTINELAAEMGVHRDTVRAWYRKDPGNFPMVYEMPFKPRFQLSEVKKYWKDQGELFRQHKRDYKKG